MTSPEEKLFQIYAQAMETPLSERADFLERACADAGVDRVEVEALMAAAEQSDTGLQEGIGAGIVQAMAPMTGARPGDRIGAYKLEKLLGQGGMGQVFLASRQNDVKMKAAVKLALSGPNDTQLLARFKREREILASLQHPHIAQLFDVGATAGNRPYFVMEYVAGVPIDQHCCNAALSMEQRLALFIEVCGAVSYAHRNLVLHRDIKPANIMVTSDGAPKLLDFGISGLMEPETAAVKTQTVVGMTPGYASPEQLDQRRLTAASDIWSLGVVLYHLLTGHTPYRIEDVSPLEFYRQVREDDVTRPSAKIDNDNPTAKTMSLSPVTLCRRLKGDLDVIIIKALAKAPDDRYESVEAFSADIRRHLEGLPVLAAAPSFGYRAGKFFKRNQAAVLSTAAFVLLLMSFSFGMYRQQQETKREAKVAQAERDTSRMVAEFLGDTFKGANPNTARGETLTAKDLLDAGAKRIETELSDQPEVRANLMSIMGASYRSLGLYTQAEPLLTKAYRLSQGALGELHPDTLDRLAELGNLYRDMSQLDKAEAYLRRAITARRQTENHAALVRELNALSLILSKKGDTKEAESLLREAYGYRDRIANTLRAGTVNNLGLLLKEIGSYAEAEPFLTQALALHQEIFPAPHPAIAASMNNLGLLAKETGDLDTAQRYWSESLAMRRRLYEPDHPKVLAGLNNLGALLKDQGDFAAAEPLFREVLAAKRTRYAPGSPKLIISLNNLAVVLVEIAETQEADLLFDEAMAIVDKHLKPTHLFRWVLMRNQALLRLTQNRPQEGLELATAAVLGLEKSQKPSSLHLKLARSIRGGALLALSRYEEAEPLLADNYHWLMDSDRRFPVHTRRLRAWLASLYAATQREDLAKSLGVDP